MEVLFPDDRTNVRPLQESSWTDLVATDQEGDQEGFANVRITLDHPWLRASDVELIDTPGAGDLSQRRTVVVLDLLSRCDGAVLLVSATQGFSMTEAVFLEHEVIGRHIPLVLVVVSNLDRVDLPREQKESVLAVICEEVARISEAMPVLPSHPLDGDATGATALEAVREQIDAMVAKGDRRAWRSHQIARQITDCIAQLLETGETALAVARSNAEERNRELLRRRDERSKSELLWEDMRLELNRRRLRRDEDLREKVLSTEPQVVEKLSLRLNEASDPKNWWEQDLPRLLHGELLVTASKSEEFLMDALARDVGWLQEEVENAFATQMSRTSSSVAGRPEITTDLKELTLEDIRHYRLYTRFGGSAGMLASFVLISPIGVAASAAALFGAEMLLKRKEQEQREAILVELRRSVDGAYREYCVSMSERLSKLYEELEEDTRRRQAAWQSSQDAAMEIGVVEPEEDLQRLTDEASALRDEILAALKA
jgi:hypothetical protein